MSEERKKKRSDIEIVGTPILKVLIVCCLPWIAFSKLDKHLDHDSEEGFELWDFYWSFPATHLSWLTLTILFGLPLWGLLGAPLVLPACVFTGVTHVALSTGVLAATIIAVIWIGLFYTVRHYRSMHEISEVRREVFENEA